VTQTESAPRLDTSAVLCWVAFAIDVLLAPSYYLAGVALHNLGEVLQLHATLQSRILFAGAWVAVGAAAVSASLALFGARVQFLSERARRRCSYAIAGFTAALGLALLVTIRLAS
jgi:hypothetical protein